MTPLASSHIDPSVGPYSSGPVVPREDGPGSASPGFFPPGDAHRDKTPECGRRRKPRDGESASIPIKGENVEINNRIRTRAAGVDGRPLRPIFSGGPGKPFTTIVFL